MRRSARCTQVARALGARLVQHGQPRNTYMYARLFSLTLAQASIPERKSGSKLPQSKAQSEQAIGV